MEDFEEQLRLHWHMNIKASSRCCMASGGNSEVPDDVERWPMVSAIPVLGHVLEPSGSIRACWTRCRNSMWKAFWANPGATAAGHLGCSDRLTLMHRAVLPQLSFRCSRWPPQRQIGSEVDTLQQKMTASLLRLPRDPGEEAEHYVRRRGRIARSISYEHGRRSQLWFGRALSWDEHLARPRINQCWPAKLRNYKGKEWLMERRALCAPAAASSAGTASVFAGRTGTRALPGKVHVRWHDGIDFAVSCRSTG